MGEVASFVPNESSDSGLIRCRCNLKAFVKCTDSEQRELLLIEFMCEKLDSHVYVEPNMLSTKTATFLMLGN